MLLGRTRFEGLRNWIIGFLLLILAVIGAASFSRSQDVGSPAHRVIIFVWDGLRPDSITPTDTPNLYRLSKRGAWFADHHSTYPTFTMMNAAAFATGAYPGKTGFYGNWLYEPGPGDKDAQGHDRRDSSGAPLRFSEPFFTEDYAVLKQLNHYYVRQGERGLLLVESLFEAAHRAHLTTAAVGKSGPAYMQDMAQGSIAFLDERMAFPLAFAKELQEASIRLPSTTPLAYPAGELSTAGQIVNPTASDSLAKMDDCVTSNPATAGTSPFVRQNQFIMNVYLKKILPKRPDLSVVWFRNPDSTEHAYGPGTVPYHDALEAQDVLLGELLEELKRSGLDATTDLIVVSDHAHSTVAGPTDVFPLRSIHDGGVGPVNPNGYSVSGEIRTAAVLAHAGFHAYDNSGCIFDPVLSGIRRDGSQVHPTETDTSGNLCGGPKGTRFTTGNYRIPTPLNDKEAIVVAPNGGSDYLYIPTHDRALVLKVARFLQTRPEYGPIFVDDRYGDVAGTLSLSTIKAHNPEGRNPDIIVSFTYDENAVVQGMKGIEYSSMEENSSRGMHGSFSPIDVHNILIAYGPDFRAEYVDPLPSANVDVAPTVARILHFDLPQADGRPLLEALAPGGLPATSYQVREAVISPKSPATGLRFAQSMRASGTMSPSAVGTYTIQLHTKVLQVEGQSYTYFDFARAIRRSRPPQR